MYQNVTNYKVAYKKKNKQTMGQKMTSLKKIFQMTSYKAYPVIILYYS